MLLMATCCLTATGRAQPLKQLGKQKPIGHPVPEHRKSGVGQRLARPVCLQTATSGEASSKQSLSDEDPLFSDLGFVILHNREGVTGVTNKLIRRIRDEEGIEGATAFFDVSF